MDLAQTGLIWHEIWHETGGRRWHESGPSGPGPVPADGAAGRLVRPAQGRAVRATPQRRGHHQLDDQGATGSRVRAGNVVVKDPKTEAGKRDVAIPEHLIPLVRDHLRHHTQKGANGLLFPSSRGEHLRASAIGRWYYPARDAAGRPDLRFHDLRHTGAVLAAQSGATRRADAPPRPHHTRRRHALPTRRHRTRPRNRPPHVPALPGIPTGPTIGPAVVSECPPAARASMRSQSRSAPGPFGADRDLPAIARRMTAPISVIPPGRGPLRGGGVMSPTPLRGGLPSLVEPHSAHFR